MEADIGDVVHPLACRRIDKTEIGKLQAGEEVLLDVADRVFDAALFMSLSDAAGGNRKAVVIGKILVAGIEQRRFADRAFQDGGFQIIDHDAADHTAEVSEGVLVAVQEVFHGFGQREFDIEQAAVTEDHDKETQAARGVPDCNGAVLPPIDLGALAGLEMERKKSRRLAWPDDPDVVPEDGDAAGIAEFLEF